MMKLRVLLLSLIVVVDVHAANIVDVYGVSPEESTRLLQKYAKKIATIMVPLNQAGIKLKPGEAYPQNVVNLLKQRAALLLEVKKKEGFAYVAIDEILYPGEKNHYITMDVVKNSEKERLRFIHKATPKIAYPKTNDIMDKMDDYVHLVFQLVQTEKKNGYDTKCPVYHCVYSFDHPQLKAYLPLFNQAAVQQKTFIIDTLNHDPNPERRASAAFLVGHFNDPREILSTVLPHVNDPDEGVRNNVIRVIGSTLIAAKITDVDAAPFLDLLASPSVTDRNKALYVLFAISQSPEGKKQLIQQGGDRLLAILQLKQLNNHDIAYLILKQLSGRDLGEHNIRACRAWLNEAHTTVA